MDRINSIPDEMLAAFIDNNVLPVESLIIKDAVVSSPELEEVIDIATDIKELRLGEVSDKEVNLSSVLHKVSSDSIITDTIQDEVGNKIIDKLL